MGRPTSRIPHWEHMSNPDFVTYASGIDYYDKPRSACLKVQEMYGIDMGFGAPGSDDPVRKHEILEKDSIIDEHGRARVRWGDGLSSVWDWGKRFHSIEEVLAYEPLKNLDMSDAAKMPVVENRDYSPNEEDFYLACKKHHPRDNATPGEATCTGFYNTMFMWPLLTFGWELFLELAGGYHEELKRLMDDFAVINRKVFKAYARLPVNFAILHDDICMARGPVCSPAWLRKFIYPYYEEWFSIFHAGGKRVIFMSDGNIDLVADDVAACGADGFVSEPFTDWKAVARKHPDKCVCGEGDNRILSTKDPIAIEKMVRSMVETAKMAGGYFMCVGNHIPWNVPPEGVKTYFDLCKELAHR